MKQVPWKDEYSIGIRLIDAQHQQLFTLYNRFVEAAARGEDTVSALLNELQKYAIFHFTAEENVMARHDYPDQDTQKAEHERFVDELHEFDLKLLLNSSDIDGQLIEFFGHWLVDHVTGLDRKFGVFCKEHGIEE